MIDSIEFMIDSIEFDDWSNRFRWFSGLNSWSIFWNSTEYLIEWFEVAILEGFYPSFGATSNTKALAFL